MESICRQSDVISASWRLKSMVSKLLAKQYAQINGKETTHYW